MEHRRPVTGIHQGVGISAAQNRWSIASQSESVRPSVAPLTAEQKKEKRREEITDEFERVFDEWARMELQWPEFFPECIQPGTPAKNIDIISDLMKVDIGKVMRTLEKEKKKYGLIPLLARGCTGQIGAVNSESFCERVLSQAALVLDEGNTLLADEEVEMLTVLRINRGFMEYMRDQYPYVVHQQFGQTVVEEED